INLILRQSELHISSQILLHLVTLKTDFNLSFALLCRLPFNTKERHTGYLTHSMINQRVSLNSLFADNLARTGYLVLTTDATASSAGSVDLSARRATDHFLFNLTGSG